MNGAGFLCGGILALIAIVVITIGIIAVAPYIAVIVVGAGFILWFHQRDEKPPDGDNTIKPD